MELQEALLLHDKVPWPCHPQPSLPSNFYNNMKVFILWGGGVAWGFASWGFGVFFWLLGFLLPKGFGCNLFSPPQMVHSLHPPSVQNTPCLHYFGLYNLGDLSKYVKNVHLPTSLVLQASQTIFSLHVSSLLVLLPGSIPFVS